MCIQTVTTLITAFVAILVAIITGGQWITNKARLRHELFDRRYTMYETIAMFLASIAIEGRVREFSERKFLIDTNNAYFIFGCDHEVKNLVNEIYKLAVELGSLDAELNTLPVGEQRSANVKRQSDIKCKLQDILDSMERKFEKYLRLDH